MTNTPSTPGAVAPAPDSAPLLDCERLDVYRVALEFQVLAAGLCETSDSVVRDQLRRASVSIVLNISEGASQWSRPQKRRYYRIALGSTTECAAIVDVLRVRGLATSDLCRRARTLLVRVVQMLTKLNRGLTRDSDPVS
jgi:four helix bundle protein